MGGGSWPSMDFLKDWMFESFESNMNGRNIVQEFAPDANPICYTAEQLAQFDQFGAQHDVDYDDSFDNGAEQDGFFHDQAMLPMQQMPIQQTQFIQAPVPFPLQSGSFMQARPPMMRGPSQTHMAQHGPAFRPPQMSYGASY